jgi:hypothetical protein
LAAYLTLFKAMDAQSYYWDIWEDPETSEWHQKAKEGDGTAARTLLGVRSDEGYEYENVTVQHIDTPPAKQPELGAGLMDPGDPDGPPSDWITVKQPVGSKVCCAAVAAMAVGGSLDYALDQMSPTAWSEDGEPYFKTRELLIFLGRHGIAVGMSFTMTEGVLRADDSLRFDVSLRGIKAILTVPSPTRPKDWEHFVFWDGKHVRDPNPALPETTDIEDYQVLTVYPLMYIH